MLKARHLQHSAQVRYAEQQWDAHQRVEFVQVTQRRQGIVQQLPIGRGQDRDSDQQHQQPQPVVAQAGARRGALCALSAQRQTRQTTRCNRYRNQHKHRLRSQQVPGLALSIGKRRPVSGAAQNLQ